MGIFTDPSSSYGYYDLLEENLQIYNNSKQKSGISIYASGRPNHKFSTRIKITILTDPDKGKKIYIPFDKITFDNRGQLSKTAILGEHNKQTSINAKYVEIISLLLSNCKNDFILHFNNEIDENELIQRIKHKLTKNGYIIKRGGHK